MNKVLVFVFGFSLLSLTNCIKAAVARVEATTTDESHLASVLHIASFAEGGGQDLSLPVPDVRHFKAAGGGYTQDSPLFSKQEEMRDIGGLPVAPRAVKPHVTPEVSVTMRCITNLVILYFVVYTIHYVVLTVKHWSLVNFGEHEENHLAGYVDTLFFAPMLCILFLAAHMRAVHLTRGQIERHGLPPWWVEWAMMLCTYSLLAQTVLAVLYSVITGQPWKDATERTKRGPGESALAVCRYVVMAGIYGGFTSVCVGVCIMEAPHSGGSEGPPMSPAVNCTVLLSVLYFAVHLVLALARALTASTRRFDSAQELQREVETTVAFAPMLCVLFVSARVRALQLDPEHGRNQNWVSYFMYACTLTVLLQTLIAAVGIMLGLQVSDLSRTSFKVRLVRGARDVAFWVLYICVCVVVLSVLLLGRDQRDRPVPSVPASIKCTMFLTALYFFVYLAQMVVRAVHSGMAREEVEPSNGFLQRLAAFLRYEAKDAVDIAPMLSVLFVTAFIRAAQITGGKGAPPGWAQNFMYVATWSVLFQILTRADALFENPPKTTRRACVMLQCLWLLLMCSCVIGVVIALFTMGPEDANGEGAISILQPPGL